MNKNNLVLPIMGFVAVVLTFASCNKNEDSEPVPVSGNEANHDYVDYGFTFDSTRMGDTINNVRFDTIVTRAIYFATCNIGATNPQDYGDYFAWGETETKSDFSYDNYFDKDNTGTTYVKYNDDFVKHIKGKDTLTQEPNFVITIGTTTEKAVILESSEDAAMVKWGGSWRIPTAKMWEQLFNECYIVWTSGYNGSSTPGYLIYKAKSDSDKGKNKNHYAGYTSTESYSMQDSHIFLPAGGRYEGEERLDEGTTGSYWIADMKRDGNKGYGDSGDIFFSSAGTHEIIKIWRYHGRLVRPVCCPIIDTKIIRVEIKQ